MTGLNETPEPTTPEEAPVGIGYTDHNLEPKARA